MLWPLGTKTMPKHTGNAVEIFPPVSRLKGAISHLTCTNWEDKSIDKKNINNKKRRKLYYFSMEKLRGKGWGKLWLSFPIKGQQAISTALGNISTAANSKKRVLWLVLRHSFSEFSSSMASESVVHFAPEAK